ncbi:hypothetical protein OG555_20885 [Kribbella sp. NBC_01484]|uniref:hypothetical protein n=1 Tax=Kribbella sp. NBC_01484 TaxID=2903579 RepID=UPI002E30009E|nr:hypothetical protein [Kribbella sp. NBC_01484]
MAPIVLAAVCLTSALPATAVPVPRGIARAAKLPSTPLDIKLTGTLTGVDLSWTAAPDANDDAVNGYVIHRVVDGVDTVLPWEPAWNSSGYEWHESERIPGATYAVAATNAEGEGPASTPIMLPPTHRAITVGHTIRLENGNTRTFAGQIAVPGGKQVVPLAPDGPTQVIGEVVAASLDGREIAFAKGQNSLWRVRADIPHATPVQILDGSSGIIRLAWSPDGAQLAFERLQPDGGSCVEIVAATGGTPIRVGCNMLMPTWLSRAQLIVKDRNSGLLEYVEAKANGVVLGTIAGTAQSTMPSVSPDHRWIAYLDGNAPALIPVSGGAPKLGTASELRPDGITWSPDGAEVLVAQPIRFGGSALVTQSVGADGFLGAGETIFRTQPSDRIGSAVWQGPRVVIPPMSGAVRPDLSIPFGTTGLATPVTTTCQFDGSPAAPCSSPYQTSGAWVGVHQFLVKAVDADGHASVAHQSVLVDVTAPNVRITSPVLDVTKAATATVTYTATDNSGLPVASYDTRWRIAPTAGNFGAYAPVKSGTTATSVLIGLAAGYEYCVSVRARDAVGNVSGWTADRCVSRPSDDRAMGAATGWTRASHQLYYLGTATVTTRNGISVSRSSVQAKRLFLIATKCGTCGSLNVYYNGKSVGIVNLSYEATVYQAIVPLPVPASFLTGSVLLTTRTAGKVYQIDGLAVRRT